MHMAVGYQWDLVDTEKAIGFMGTRYYEVVVDYLNTNQER